MTDSSKAADPPASSFSPFRYQAFAILWVATVISNIGGWMQSAAAGWLMTTLNPDAFIVSMVQAVASLPIFLFAIPAGALSDIIDRRWFLIWTQVAVVVIVALFAVLVALGLVTPNRLLFFTFLGATASALATPTWQAIVPQLVPRPNLQPAVALNSVGVNVSRAIGPALAGIIISAWGIAAPYWLNALSTIGVIAALFWWRPSEANGVVSKLPRERFIGAIGAGLRHARHNSYLRAALIRATGFFLFGSAYWALLPLVARNQIAGGPELYGVLLGAIGGGAVAAAFVLPMLKRRLGPDRLVAAGTCGTALALLLFGLARSAPVGLAASLIAGASWIAVLATLNVSAQFALPAWVRGRGLSIYVTVMFGSLTLGSAIWGKAAGLVGLPAAHIIAAAGALLAIPLLRRWKLQTDGDLDLSPSMAWPQPVLPQDLEATRGPVMVTVEYRVKAADRGEFLRAVAALSEERRRDGAFSWEIFQDIESTERFVETFLLDSWLDHLRQHERVTHADSAQQALVKRFQTEGEPKVTHWVAPSG